MELHGKQTADEVFFLRPMDPHQRKQLDYAQDINRSSSAPPVNLKHLWSKKERDYRSDSPLGRVSESPEFREKESYGRTDMSQIFSNIDSVIGDDEDDDFLTAPVPKLTGKFNAMGIDKNRFSEFDSFGFDKPKRPQSAIPFSRYPPGLQFQNSSRFDAYESHHQYDYNQHTYQEPYFQPAPELDPEMAHALHTLSNSGSLTPQQIQQIQMQLTLNSRKNPSRSSSPHRNPRSSPPRQIDKENVRNVTDGSKSAILEEFKNQKNRKIDLIEIQDHFVEFSCDQHGSRFIQQKLESCMPHEKAMIFAEVAPKAMTLMADVFGNYVIQKFFEFGNEQQISYLGECMVGRVIELSLQMYGCRVVQKALEHVGEDLQQVLIAELEGHVLKLVKDQNGNHVIQKAIERIHADKIRFIIDSFHGQVYALATHPYGCRVIQRLFEHCSDHDTEPLLEELFRYAISLVQDQYGNYVIQHILEHGKPKDKNFVIQKVMPNFVQMSKHKFASNVIEKCVVFCSKKEFESIFDQICTTKPDGTTPLYAMMKDQFANYVVQKMLDCANENQKIMMVTKIKQQLPALRKFTYGKHLMTKVEKLIVQYQIE